MKKIKNENLPEELKKREALYLNALNTDGYPPLEFPSLKYSLFNLKLSVVFNNQIGIIKTDIETLKRKLISLKENPLISNELKKLDEIDKKLVIFLNEEKEDYDFYKEYLITIAKRRDVINNEIAKRVYTNISEEIIVNRIKKFLKYEKTFVIFNYI